MSAPCLLNTGTAQFLEPQSITCTDSAWLDILSGDKWTLDFLGQFDPGAAGVIYSEICKFQFGGGLNLYVDCVAAGIELGSNVPGAVPIVLNAILDAPSELTRIEYISGMMRVSEWQWPQWEPICQGRFGPWVDVSAMWPAVPCTGLVVGATIRSDLAGASPMWTVQNIAIANGVLS